MRDMDKKKAYMKSYAQRPERKAKMRAYNKTYSQKPEVKERNRIRHKAYLQKPGIKERRKIWAEAYNQRPDVKEQKKAHWQQPKTKEKKRIYQHRPEVHKRRLAQARAYGLQKKYGLTSEAFNSLLASQGGVCAACGSDEWSGNGPEVDHNHNTGAIRGIICHGCNVSAGFMDDDPARIRKLAEYLEKSNV